MEIKRWQSGTEPRISIVIPTIPATDHDEIIEIFQSQKFGKNWEVLVVIDDKATDRRCEARNIGLKEAQAAIVAHTDDDVEPPDDWLANVHMAFEPDVICVEGCVQGGMTYTGTGLYRGCNIAVRRREALRVGGWNEEYAGWRDDTEFGWRLEEQGAGECIYDGKVLMRHPPEPRTISKVDQEIMLYTRFPEKYRERIPSSMKKTLFVALAKRSWGRPLLKFVG